MRRQKAAVPSTASDTGDLGGQRRFLRSLLPAGLPRLRFPRGRRLVLLVLGVLVLVGFLVWVVVAALLAQAHLQRAKEQVRGLSSSDSFEQLADPVAAAHREAAAADALMRQPGPALAARIPFFGRSLAAERDVARAGAVGLGAADRLLPLVRSLSDTPGTVDLPALDSIIVELRQASTDLRAPIARLARTPTSGVPGRVRSAVQEAQDRLDGIDVTLQRAADSATALRGMLGAEQPRTIVIALMNNAELRGAGGYASSIAVMTTSGGKATIGPLLDTNTFDDPPNRARAVGAPPDYLKRWGPFLANTTVWKNVLMSADGPASAATACAVAKLAPGVPCDGVILMDVRTLSSLTTLTGPVQLPDGSRAGGDDLLRALLVDAYVEAGNNTAAQIARRAALQAAADASLRQALDRPAAVPDQIRVLAEAARGRHLVIWSARPDEQRALEAADLAGDVNPRGADLNLVSFNQLSISKLDYYVSRRVTVDATVDRTSATVTQTASLKVMVPSGLPTYVTGKYDGRLKGVLDLAVSPRATITAVTANGAATPFSYAVENGSLRVVVTPDVANGTQARFAVTYTVPITDGRYRLDLFPQPLAHDAQLQLSVRAGAGLRLESGRVLEDKPYDAVQHLEVRAVSD